MTESSNLAAVSNDLNSPKKSKIISILKWWPILLGPAAMALVYLGVGLEWEWIMSKPLQETIAIVLMSIAILCYAVRVGMGRRLIHLLLFALSIAFLCREIHFEGSDNIAYATCAVLVVVAVWKRKRLMAETSEGQLRVWVIAAAVTYFLSQMIARRVFAEGRIPLPHEQDYHIYLEELVENTAHIVLIITAFSDKFKCKK